MLEPTIGKVAAQIAPRLLNRNAAAAYCGMTAPHFTLHVASYVPPLKFGKKLLWDVKAIDHWLNSQSNGTCVSTSALLELLQ